MGYAFQNDNLRVWQVRGNGLGMSPLDNVLLTRQNQRRGLNRL